MKDYIQYLQEVLGLQTVMVKSGEESPIKTSFFLREGPFEPSEVQHAELVFLNILTQPKESFFLPEVRDLFDKMKAAMKLKNVQVLELDCTVDNRAELPSELAKLIQSRLVVVFSSFPKDIGEFIIKGSGKWIETYSPSYLLEDPAAKKVVWNDLQKVMKELGL